MIRSNAARAVRHLRRRRGWRQVDLAARAETSRSVVSRVERGQLRPIPLGTLERIVSAVGAALDLTLRWEGERLDRLIDRVHAWLAQTTAELLTATGWEVRSEVSFNHFGDRGRVDLLAYYPSLGILLVIELKSAIGDIQETLGRLDIKVRLSRQLAESVGWPPPRAFIPVLVLPESRTTRRILAAHATLFARSSLRGRSALAWVRHPSTPAPAGAIWFATLPDSREESVTRGQRVRTGQTGA